MTNNYDITTDTDENAIIQLSRCPIHVNHHEESRISWSNNYLMSQMKQGISVFDYSHNIRCKDKQIDFCRYFIRVSQAGPATGLFTQSLWKKGLDNYDMTELVLDPVLWPHNKKLMEEATSVSSAKWSPSDFMQNSTHVLAVVNCAGNVDIYAQTMNTWSLVLDLSSLVKKRYPECLHNKDDLVNIKKSTYAMATQAICWAPEMNDNNSCHLVTAQKNGNILFWSLVPNENYIQGDYLGMFESDLDFYDILWIQKTKNKFMLLCSEVMGQLIVFDCEIVDQKFNLITTQNLWPDNDQMSVKFIQTMNYCNKCILTFSKNRHLIVQMTDENMNPISQFIKNINDFRITAIVNSPSGLIVTTVNSKVYRVCIKVINDSLNVDIKFIEIKDISPTRELYSLSISKNNALWALGMADRRMSYKKEPCLVEIVFATLEINLVNVIDIILNNPTRKLTDYWDCLELLRYTIHKYKKMPEINYNKLYIEAESDVYKLKLYLVLLIMYTELGAMKNYYMTMPEKSEEYIRERLLVCQAVNVINKLGERQSGNIVLDNFDIECFNGAKNYLEFFCQKHKRSLESLVNIDTVNEFKSDVKYICQCCNEELDGFTCKNNHLNMFCSLTFTPILSEDYLFCKICNVTARLELCSQAPLCVFCDFRLCKYS